MSGRKIDNIILITFICASILCIAVVARIYVVQVLKMDEFSGFIAFLVCGLLFGALYFAFQSIVNDFLSPRLERLFGREQSESKLAEEAVPEAVTLSQYSEYNLAAQQRVAEQQQQTLENVICYTMEKLSGYMSEADMKALCENIHTFQYANELECEKIETFVVVDSKVRVVDILHYGWNIVNQFKKSGPETSAFLKQVFARSFEKYEKSTIKSKLRMEGGTIIKLQKEI